MKKLVVLSSFLAVIPAVILFSCHHNALTPEKQIALALVNQVDTFTAACRSLESAAEKGVPLQDLQRLFLQARRDYKTIEWAAEYFQPATARFMNGPPVDEVEMGSHQVFPPAGLQVIEGLLFPRLDSGKKQELIRQAGLLQTVSQRYKVHFANIGLFDWQIFDATKLEVFRIETLGISGFDNPLTLKSVEECAISLKSMRNVLALYEKTDTLTALLDTAVGYLNNHSDFNSFDRAAFITHFGNPLSTGITNVETTLNIHIIRYNRLLNQDAKTIFDKNAFNIDAYSPDPSSFMTPEKVALGSRLFSDPILSGDGSRSCQSCHQPEKAFTDGLIKNTVLGNKAMLKRNTPTLINAALQPSQFYDMRVNTLEDQSHTVIQNIEEMHGAMSLSVLQLWQDTVYRRLFSTAFPRKERVSIDTLEVMNAIGCYVRSLVRLDSRFDDFMRGDKNALTSEEVDGFNLFMGKAKCATCHYMPLFNGTFPPRYVKTESEVIGVPASRTKNEIDPDQGRYAVINTASFLHSFKIPTLRNASRTAPYMHNGVFETLEQVMDFYNKGGGSGLGIKLDNQTLPFDKLDLSEKEKSNIIAFIKSLDSK